MRRSQRDEALQVLLTMGGFLTAIVGASIVGGLGLGLLVGGTLFYLGQRF